MNYNTGTMPQGQMGMSKQIEKRDRIVNTFISRFTDQSFLEAMANISIYHSDFGSLNPSIKSSDAIRVMKQFLKHLQKDVTSMKIEHQFSDEMLKHAINFVYQLLQVREEAGSRLITYDNLHTHFPRPSILVQNMIENICSGRIKDMDEFRRMFENVSTNIQLYNELRQARTVLLDWDKFLHETQDPNASLISMINSFKDIVAAAYNSLTNMPTLNKIDHGTDCFVISDRNSLTEIADVFTTHMMQTYSFYKSGYPIIDTNVGGLESSTLHLISGPSNHAKSIFMINLCYRVIKYNLLEFEPNDAIIFVTLEDDIFKLMRRFISIFGNIDPEAVKSLMVKTSALFKKQNNKDITNNTALTDEFKNILIELLASSILRVTNQKVKVIIKHCNENVFTPIDATRLIDDFNMKGSKVKLMMIDYVDVMVPSALGGNFTENDYFAHGQIIHELRLAARNYGVPIVTITQNTRESENSQQSMGNNLVGDSYKKVRYSDYIYMIRMRDDLDLLQEQVKNDVTSKADTITLQDVTGNTANSVTPFEVKITKAKEGQKNRVKFHLFCSTNLRIYDNVNELYTEAPENQKSTTELRNHIELIGTNSMNTYHAQPQQQPDVALI